MPPLNLCPMTTIQINSRMSTTSRTTSPFRSGCHLSVIRGKKMRLSLQEPCRTGIKTYSMESMSHLLSFSVNRSLRGRDGFVVSLAVLLQVSLKSIFREETSEPTPSRVEKKNTKLKYHDLYGRLAKKLRQQRIAALLPKGSSCSFTIVQ